MRTEVAETDVFIVNQNVFKPEWETVNNTEDTNAEDRVYDSLGFPPFSVTDRSPTADQEKTINGDRGGEVDLD